jgi:hypothetical protein
MSAADIPAAAGSAVAVLQAGQNKTQAASLTAVQDSFTNVTTEFVSIADQLDASHWKLSMAQGFRELGKLQCKANLCVDQYSQLMDVDGITSFCEDHGIESTVKNLKDIMRNVALNANNVATRSSAANTELEKTQKQIEDLLAKFQTIHEDCRFVNSSAAAGTKRLCAGSVFICIGAGAAAVGICFAAPPVAVAGAVIVGVVGVSTVAWELCNRSQREGIVTVLTSFRDEMRRLSQGLSHCSLQAAQCCCDLDAIHIDAQEVRKHVASDSDQTYQLQAFVENIISGDERGANFRRKIEQQVDVFQQIQKDAAATVKKANELTSNLNAQFKHFEAQPAAVVSGYLNWKQYFAMLQSNACLNWLAHSVTNLSLDWGECYTSGHTPQESTVVHYDITLEITNVQTQTTSRIKIRQRYSECLKFHQEVKHLLPADCPGFPPKNLLPSDRRFLPGKAEHRRKELLKDYLKHVLVKMNTSPPVKVTAWGFVHSANYNSNPIADPKEGPVVMPDGTVSTAAPTSTAAPAPNAGSTAVGSAAASVGATGAASSVGAASTVVSASAAAPTPTAGSTAVGLDVGSADVSAVAAVAPTEST